MPAAKKAIRVDTMYGKARLIFGLVEVTAFISTLLILTPILDDFYLDLTYFIGSYAILIIFLLIIDYIILLVRKINMKNSK